MTSRLRSAHLAAAALILAGVATAWTGSPVRAAAHSQAPAGSVERSVWDGVYSEAQSKRGEKVYADSCVTCHGAELTGSQIVPALVGEDFVTKWNGSMAGDIFELIRTTMPQDAPDSLKSDQVADVLALIFNKNRMPSGKTDLVGNFDGLKTIRIEPTKKH